MKIKNAFLSTGLCIIFLFPLVSVSAAGIFDDNDANWRRLFMEMKKINARLIELETGTLQGVQRVQEELLRQLQEIKAIIPDLRGTVETSQAEMINSLTENNKKLSSMEAQLKFEILPRVDNQSTISEQMKVDLIAQFDQLKNQLAADMEQLAQVNRGSMQALTQGNAAAIAQVAQQLNAQNQNLDQVQAIFKSELIPAIIQQTAANRQALLAEMAGARAKNNEVIQAGFSTMEQKNDALIDILGKSLNENLETKGLVGSMQQNISKTNDNIIFTQNTLVQLKEILVQRMEAISADQEKIRARTDGFARGNELIHQNLMVANEKINKLAASLGAMHNQNIGLLNTMSSFKGDMNRVSSTNAMVDEKMDKLIDSSAALFTQSAQMGARLEQRLQQSVQTIEAGQANVMMANEKLTKLIDILKAMANEQGQVQQVYNAQGQILTKQDELRKLFGQLVNGQNNLKSGQGDIYRDQSLVKKSQEEVQKISGDLRRGLEQVFRAQEEAKRGWQDIQAAQQGILKEQVEIKKSQLELRKDQAEMKLGRPDASSFQQGFDALQQELNKRQRDIMAGQNDLLKALAEMKVEQAEIKVEQGEMRVQQGEIKSNQGSLNADQGEIKAAMSDLKQKADLDMTRTEYIGKILNQLAENHEEIRRTQEQISQAITELIRKAKVSLSGPGGNQTAQNIQTQPVASKPSD